VLRTSSYVIAISAMVVALSTTVQAADETLTLACSGTVTDISQPVDGRPEPISKGIIVNFTTRTVMGLVFPLKMTGFDELTVFFEGSNDTESTVWKVSGSMDRVTGDMKAASMKMNRQTFISLDLVYSLKCRPAQRMF
jgi:hypothetical protein